MRARAILWTGLFLLGLSLPGSAQGEPEPRFLEDAGHIVVVEHDGESYDRNTPTGDLNAAPRQRLARKLIETHGDFYDFIVVFTNFDFDLGGAVGLYSNVRNEVEGINVPIVDNGASFGSPSRLQGYVDMGPVRQYRVAPYSLEPADPNFRRTLGILAHEIGHRWLAAVRFDTGSGARDDLLGEAGAHWSFLLSSEASFLYGNAWEPVEAGGARYRSVEVRSRFSELDLYLMGFAPPEEVSPLTLLVNPDVDPTRLPQLGVEIEAADVETITIDHILASEGVRSPSHEASQKDFSVAFVFLTAEGLRPTELDLEGVERVRAGFMDAFFGLTRGRALVDPDLQTVAPVTSGATPDVTLATLWLESQQRSDGRYEAHPLTALRDTAAAVTALSTLGVRGATVDDARAWMSLQNPSSVDYLARAIAAGAGQPLDLLASLRNADGGFGLAPGYRTDPLDTAVALGALVDSELAPEVGDALASMQLPDGSWSSIAGQPGDVLTTSEAALALARTGGHTLSVQDALSWLALRQQLDGGFGDGPSAPHATARVLEAFLNGTAPPSAVDRATTYLRETQSENGSWNESVFETAAVLSALVPSTFVNLTIGSADVALDPDPPEVGETVEVAVTVRNRALVASGTFDVQLFVGDPEAGGLAVGAPQIVGGLAGGSNRVLGFSWDTTGLEGRHTLFAVADFAGAVDEVSKEDNIAAREVEVLPPLANLVVALVTAEPASPVEGSPATLTARVDNRGSVASTSTRVRFHRELPRLGIELGEASLPGLVPGGSADVSIVWDTTAQLGAHSLYAVADPGDLDVRERFESDNEASVSIEVRPPPPAQPDLEIRSFTLAPSTLERLPQDVTATARIANTGRDPVPAALVELFQGHPELGGVLVTSRTVAVGGDTGVDVALSFTVGAGGSRTYFLRVDASPVVERDDTNNLASADLRDLMDVVDVTAVSGSIVLSAGSLDPGDVLFVDATVRNSGTRPLGSVAVALFYEVAPGGPFRLASTASLPIAPGASATVRLSWTANRSGAVPLELRVDPDDVLSETNEADNALATSVDVTASTLPNLSLTSSDIDSTPATLVEGAAATLEARIRNLGDGDAGPFDVTFFAGDPDTNGFVIATTTVVGVAARGETVAAVSWSPVNVRGEAFLFVEVDSGGAVEEIDEGDNLVFRVVDVEGLPDLLATAAQLRLTPAFPRSGEMVVVEAGFSNAGDQVAGPMGVEIRLDDPAAGPLIGAREVLELPPGATDGFAATWDTSGVEGEHAIYLVLDVRDDVLEQREDNNVLRVPVALQDADVFVTPLFFSPNGDGVQDEASFFYRVGVAGETRVEVRDAQETPVRALVAASGESASVVWDGRRDDGVLARDGAYAFVLLDDGAEVLRRRVVLDTNRASVVDALGSDLVGFTQLTCPLPGALEGPAWLPGDRAAYVIVTAADAGAPEYPVGLYRVSSDARSLELVLADDAFADAEFVDRAGRFFGQRLRPVSADGERALIRSLSGGLQVLELATGARTPLGHEHEAMAAWTSDGRKILVASSTGLFFHGSDAGLLQQLVAGDVEAAVLAPDELRIVYRRREEIVLRILNVDGSGDRVLASTDAAAFFDRLPSPDQLDLQELYFLDSEEGPVFAWFFQNEEELAGPFLVNLDDDTLSTTDFLGALSADERWEISFAGSFHVARRLGGRETRPILPSSLGGDLGWSYRDTHIDYRAAGGDGCVGSGIWAARSLLNGEAEFRLTRLPSRFGVRISGTVADQNLDAYTLDYAEVRTPDAFAPIQPPSNVPVIADTITTWIPPGPGDYLVRLSLRDKAGNVSERLDRIFWEETLPIASLRRAPAYVSPNGDGVQDDVLVEYDVLTPANLVFHVRDDEGRSVRRIDRDELAPGPASFVWDGADDFGVSVADGRYVLEIRSAELPVFVDATAPELDATYSELYTYAVRGASERLAVDLEGRILDENLEAWELSALGGEIVESALRQVGTETGGAVILERALPVQGLEIRARDRAGNVAVHPLAGPSREVRVVRARSDVVGPLEPGPPAPVDHQVVSTQSPLSLSAQASFAADLRFEYGAVGGAQLVEIPVSRSVGITASELELGTSYVGRFVADAVESQEVEFTVGPDAIFLSGGLRSPLGIQIALSHSIQEPLVEGRLLRTSGQLVRAYAPVPRYDEIFVEPPPCGIDHAYIVQATGASGTIYRSTTTIAFPAIAPFAIRGVECLSVDDAAIEAQADPNALPSNEAAAFLRTSLSEPPESVLLLLDDGSGELEVGRAAPGKEGTEIRFDVSALPEGPYFLRTRAIRSGGETVEGDYGLGFVLDQSPPEVSILAPPEGSAACIATVNGGEAVWLDVLVRDREIAALRVELLRPDGGWERLQIGDPPALPQSDEFAARLPVFVPGGLSGERTLRLVAQNRRIVSERAGRPASIPPLWPDPFNNGGRLGADVRTLVFSTTLGLGPLTTDPAFPALFSPNGDGAADVVRVRGDALEAASLTVRVFTAGLSPVLERTIVADSPQGAGAFELVWDGRDDGGLFVADGEYDVEVEAVNGCGAESTASIRVEVDNTPPTVAIDNLVDDQPISIGVEIEGVAWDDHFDNYVLELGEGAAPSAFTQLTPPVLRQVRTSDVLGNWSVGDLEPGIYTLRVTATDDVANRASAQVRVEVLASDFIVRHEAAPALFSPNGDAIQDVSDVRFELQAEARVTLAILDASDDVVATLIDGSILAAGPHARIWDGLGAADGEYVAWLRAENPTASTLFEEARISIAVDTRPPDVAVSSPAAEGFVSLPANVGGSITDDHLERYTIQVGPAAGALVTVADDSLPVTGVITPLPSLADGTYRLRALASDRAGNQSELALTFDVDGAPPALALTAPSPGSFLTRPPESVSVTGSVVEENLERYDLELGFGDPPSVFVALAGGTSLPAGPALADWDLGGLPDGSYTLRLTARDRAANFAIVETDVVLDASPPTVGIDEPAAGAVVSGAIAARGTLSDAHFLGGALSVAPADRPGALTELASFASPVASGVLVETLALTDGDYILSLRAEDRAGNVASTTSAFSVDTEPPLPPSGLTASPEDAAVALAWTESPSADAAGYHVLRDGARITTTPVTTTSYVDAGLSEGVFSYRVLAVDRAGLESAPTAPARATIDRTPPNVVLRSPDEGARVRVEVEVVGTAYSESDFLEYRLSAAPIGTPSSPTLLKRSSVPVSFDVLALWRPLVDGDYILTLEGEDTSGNVATDEVRVSVDNAPPGAPVLLRAEALAEPDEVEIEWSGPGDADVEGFLVFRNGRVANAPGNVSGSLRPFLVPGPIHVDVGLPDGEHCYRVAAMDLAGNISGDSNELCVFLDNRAPAAAIIDPADGARFDASRRLLAESEDLDLATVSFEHRAEGEALWTVIGVDGDGEPFEVDWDITGLAFGDYALRAVATDVGTRSDPAPAAIGVTLGDVTPPSVPAGLSARVVGDRVELAWSAVADADLAGYRIFRGDTLVLEPDASAVAAADVFVPDGRHEYTIRSVDADGNESDAGSIVAARVYAPELVPGFPVFETPATTLPGAGAEPGAGVRLFDAGTTTELAVSSADASGGFAFDALPLPLGAHVVDAEATDADGNVSRRSNEALLIRNEVPAQPSGFTATSSGDEASLAWSANGEADLSGYLVTRDGELLNPRALLRPAGLIPTAHEARASVNDGFAGRVIGGSGAWFIGATEEGWIEVELAEARHLDEIRLRWTSSRSARDFDLLVELEGRLVPIVRARGEAATFLTEHTLPIAVRTARVRLHIYSSATPFPILLDELELVGILPETATALTDRPSAPGLFAYAVEAIDTLGGRSPEAGPVTIGVGDLSAPEPPSALAATVGGVDVSLSWTASPSADVAGYRVFRDGATIGSVAGTSATDADLLNGTYTYHVIAVDGVGNESAPSNTVVATVDVAPPSPPLLNVSALPAGRALALDWTESLGALGVSQYVVSRAATTGGPYAEIAAVDGATFAHTDRGLVDGVELFYVVRALDARGETSGLSNEASGVPADGLAPPAPVWVAPVTPLTLAASGVRLVGASEPSSTVEIFRDGAVIGSTIAAGDFATVALSLVQSTSNASGRFAISPDRTLVAEMGTQFSFGTGEAHLYDLRTGSVRIMPYVEGGSFERDAAFSPDGGRVAVSTTLGGPPAIRILDLETEVTEVIELIDVPNTIAWISDDELAVVMGGADIRVLHLAADTETTIHTSSSFEPARLVASPDRTRLAWREGDALYVMPSAGGAPVLVYDDFRLDEFLWTSSRTLVFDAFDVGIHFFDVETATSTHVDGTRNLTRPRSLGVRDLVSAFDGSVLHWVREDGSVVELGEPPQPFSGDFIEWSSELAIAGVTSSFTLGVLETPGRVELDVKLVPGRNLVHGRAMDEAGNASPDSELLELTYDPSALADLAVDGAIAIVPAAPVSGEPASLTIPVINRGASASAASVVVVTGADAGGSLYSIGGAAIPPLQPGQRATPTLSWNTAGRLGPQAILATLDPLELVDEADEDNNTATSQATVVGAGGLVLSISTGRASYGAGQNAELTVAAVNAGAEGSFALETRIEDASGVLVAEVDARAIRLAFAASTRYAVFWETGSFLAGSYFARVDAVAGGDVVASATSPFELTRALRLALDVVSDRPSYAQGDAVRLLASLTDEGGNAPLRDLSLRYRIFGPSTSLVFERMEPIGYLAIGGTAASDTIWTSGADEPGTYGVVVDAFEAGELVASAGGSFALTPATAVNLTGALTLSASAVPVGGDVVASYTIENRSVLDLAAGVVRIALFDPVTATTRASGETILSIAGGDTATGELRVATAGLELGRYTVVLSAGATSLSSLATAPVVLFATPAAPSRNAPAEGASAPQHLLLSVNNATNPNAETLAYEFELYLEPGLATLVASASGLPEGASTTSWSVLTFLQENRRYYWRARASDRYATSDWMSPAEVFVDSIGEPPGAPTLSAPPDGLDVDVLRPILVVGNAFDPESDVLTYTFELYRDAGLTDLALSIEDVVETGAETAVTLPQDLDEDRTYYWRARAHDGGLAGDWMPAASFRVNTANQAPNAPAPVEPVGVRVGTRTPELVAAAAVDPEADPLTHTFQIDVTDRFDSASRQESPPLADVRWMPPTPLEENAVYFWRVRAADLLASGPFSAAVSFRVDVTNEPPSAPTPQRPSDGSVVESATPTLSVLDAVDPEEDSLTYGFEVYEDEALTTLVASVGSLPAGAGETAWTVTPRLAEETTYHWIARAHDGSAEGPPTLRQSFRVNVVNEEPTAPLPVSPAQDAKVSELSPVLVVANATDPDGDSLTYVFEVYEDELLETLVESSGEIAEGAGETAWTMSAGLEENRLYYWRVRAFDGRLEGAWMATARFRFSLVNEPPTVPAPLAPAEGEVVAEIRPTLVVAASTDPEDDVIRYTFEVYRDPTLTDLVAGSPELEETSWAVSVDLEENAAYYWRATASDGGASSAPSDALRFTVNAVDEPPTVPGLVSPDDGATVDPPAPTLVVDNATSPDGLAGGPLVYHFALYADATLTDVVAEDAAVPEGDGGRTSWEPPVTLNPGATYHWRARAIDARGLASEWAPSFVFLVDSATGECPPEWKDDFERYPTFRRPTGWRLERERLFPYFFAADVAGSKRLVSSITGRGSLLFAGAGEAFDWRSYELEGELRQRHVELFDDGHHEEPHCAFAAGVAFYARPSEGTSYRLELTGPHCSEPQARLVKIVGGARAELARVELEPAYDEHALRFHVEAINGPSSTSLFVRLNGRVHDEERTWTFEAEDAEGPLRGGTVGAWSSFAAATWDDFHVREIPGLSSGISGDADGDGVCDVDFDAGACGDAHVRWVNATTGVVHVENAGTEPGRFRFRLIAHHEGPFHAELPDGSVAEIRTFFGLSHPVEFTMPPGVHSIHLTPAVYVKGYRWEHLCP